jgi:hypothetical protein
MNDKKNFDSKTNLFFDEDPAWNGMANWDFECADWIHAAQKTAKIFSILVIILVTVPAILSGAIAKAFKKPEQAEVKK